MSKQRGTQVPHHASAAVDRCATCCCATQLWTTVVRPGCAGSTHLINTSAKTVHSRPWAAPKLRHGSVSRTDHARVKRADHARAVSQPSPHSPNATRQTNSRRVEGQTTPADQMLVTATRQDRLSCSETAVKRRVHTANCCYAAQLRAVVVHPGCAGSTRLI